MFDHRYGDAYNVYSVLTILVLFTETAIVVVSFGHRRMRTELYKYTNCMKYWIGAYNFYVQWQIMYINY